MNIKLKKNAILKEQQRTDILRDSILSKRHRSKLNSAFDVNITNIQEYSMSHFVPGKFLLSGAVYKTVFYSRFDNQRGISALSSPRHKRK